jgi:hypothetical protein
MPTTKPLASILPCSIAKSKLLKTIYASFFLFVEVVGPHSFILWVASVTSLCTFQALFSHSPVFSPNAPTQLTCNDIFNWHCHLSDV